MYYSHDQYHKLRHLAQQEGLQTEYLSGWNVEVHASPEAMIGTLKALGTELKDDLSDIDSVITEKGRRDWNEVLEPVSVSYDDEQPVILIRQSSAMNSPRAELTISLESGQTTILPLNLGELPITRQTNFNNTDFTERSFSLPAPLPMGYHTAKLALGDREFSTTLVSAPRTSYQYEAPSAGSKTCGIFAPLYAIHSDQTWGIADLSDMERLMDWSYEAGSNFVGTLPLLSCFLDKPILEPSPYSPVSRIFWNELYVDPRRAEEWAECEGARKIAEGPEFIAAINRMRGSRETDPRGTMLLKRPILDKLAERFFSSGKENDPAYKQFLKLQPTVQRYAKFRAVCDRTNQQWKDWPERMRNGELRPDDYDTRDMRYYLYCQWLAHQQLTSLAKSSEGRGRGLYLDLPVSVHGAGFDVWSERDSFSLGAAAGCPPDPVFPTGQNWEILPMHPIGSRRNGYRYFRACLANHMRYAGILRLDHIMGLYRLFWIPHGLGAKNGAYVHYRSKELFALMNLESQRNRCTLIGEDLGTVPPVIREKMESHGIMGIYVQQIELDTKFEAQFGHPFRPIPRNSIASINTHDMPPFASYWCDTDLDECERIGLLSPNEKREEKERRGAQKGRLFAYLERNGFFRSASREFGEILRAIHALLGRSHAKAMIVNLEDLWLETLRQNTPATRSDQLPNWRRKMRYKVEELKQHFTGVLADIVSLRRGGN